MEQVLHITGVKNITNIEKPIVVFEVQGKDRGIARTPQQTIMDFQNSHLLPATVTDINDPQVIELMRNIAGGTVTANVRFFKAGDQYVIEKGHPALQKGHPDFGNVKLGDKLNAKSDGAWVEGFLQLRYSPQQNMAIMSAKEVAKAFTSMLGGVNIPTAAPAIPIEGTAADAAGVK